MAGDTPALQTNQFQFFDRHDKIYFNSNQRSCTRNERGDRADCAIISYFTVDDYFEIQKYTCVMHPEVVMDHPGKCPKCGMTLVPKKAEEKPKPKTHEAAHPMHGEQAAHASHQHDMSMEHMSMQSSVNIADPMSRESSGTAWVPDSTPMYGTC